MRYPSWFYHTRQNYPNEWVALTQTEVVAHGPDMAPVAATAPITVQYWSLSVGHRRPEKRPLNQAGAMMPFVTTIDSGCDAVS